MHKMIRIFTVCKHVNILLANCFQLVNEMLPAFIKLFTKICWLLCLIFPEKKDHQLDRKGWSLWSYIPDVYYQNMQTLSRGCDSVYTCYILDCCKQSFKSLLFPSIYPPTQCFFQIIWLQMFNFFTFCLLSLQH